MSFPLTIEPHRECWARDFATEASRIASALGPALVALHHIGSTAIPGLHAKPIIDMLGEAQSLEGIDARQGAMESLGYEAMGEFGLLGRRYFRKNNGAGVRTHHVHAFIAGSPGLVRHLAFRDFLRCHPRVAREYGALKLRLVESCGGDLEAYIAGKDAFVKDVERRALEWYGRRGLS
jgi:GrpB-like predicted nucleotidyltransferase (UPF0157 family)